MNNVMAHIEQWLEFDSKEEWDIFHTKLKNGKKNFKMIDSGKMPNGKYLVLLKRQYNNNVFLERM